MSKLAEYSQDFWIAGTLVFMALTVVVGIAQLFRGQANFRSAGVCIGPHNVALGHHGGLRASAL
jgi:hypothetical protein